MALTSAMFTFQASKQSEIPEGSGVYELICAGTTIYYGWTVVPGLRVRIREHFAGKHGSCTQIGTQFRFEEHDDPEARCKELVAEFVGRTGRVPRCNM